MVHIYAQVDDRIVRESLLEGVQDLSDFSQAIARLATPVEMWATATRFSACSIAFVVDGRRKPSRRLGLRASSQLMNGPADTVAGVSEHGHGMTADSDVDRRVAVLGRESRRRADQSSMSIRART
jgi:hypothetical protein